jgi:cyanuric acid amidohydrolase
MTVDVVAYDTVHPGDTSDLETKLSRIDPAQIRRLALLVKTEGNSDLNDFSREYALQSARLALQRYGGIKLLDRSSFLFSTGCEGAMTPFGYLFVDTIEPAGTPLSPGSALAIGCATSRSLRPEEIGTRSHADLTAEAVRAAMEDARVGREDVALAIIKTPVASLMPTASRSVRNRRITSGFSKAVGALGAGIALGEVEPSRVVEDAFDSDHSLHARRAMVFSGAEIDRVEVLLLGNRPGAPGGLTIETGFLVDLLDAGGIRRTLAGAGCTLADGVVANPERVAAMLLKVGASANGAVRGNRTTIKSSHIDMDKHVRAAVSGIVGSILGTTKSFISANTVHQAPPGGGICACIVRKG